MITLMTLCVAQKEIGICEVEEQKQEWCVLASVAMATATATAAATSQQFDDSRCEKEFGCIFAYTSIAFDSI